MNSRSKIYTGKINTLKKDDHAFRLCKYVCLSKIPPGWRRFADTYLRTELQILFWLTPALFWRLFFFVYSGENGYVFCINRPRRGERGEDAVSAIDRASVEVYLL
jgi:hypothetical protein